MAHIGGDEYDGGVRRVALALLLLSGCADDEAWHADPSFTTEEREAIVEAEAWMASRVGRPSRGVVFDGECSTRCIRRWTEPGGRFFPAGTIALNPEGRILDTAHGRTAYRFKALVAHELGHYFGLRHHDGQGVMNEEALTFGWTEASAESCARDVRELPEAKLLTCAAPDP